ncbi:NAD-dependent epimerase/dehydratase family protein [Companilactobacillus halodurans]|uniref:NAD-dependent epimerase/dehydratase family protein n=1 Tax=Companilactobacillus halodurans TaxID=2584183 RepID=A0A5P0ZMG8_9LACO|nr:NAD(P)H-binding protein [Companilactobacillus halodurans]MQS75376.1 NAD-dependent epimerase/dehydratase family protein [Companilactobacillus halodurans]MQS97320.1 NAD-dependent epimerase/dehydratase family protein [Companilactobacillus halodurans]
MSKKVVIFGANGFLGGEFAEQFIENGDSVVSVSRTGEPLGNKSWYSKVDWKVGNALSKGFWTQYLKDADVVVDTIGEYQEDANEDLTFRKVNYQSALNIADAAEENKVPIFIYISADDIPGANEKYISTKRDAEENLNKRNFRTIILRPSRMVTDDDVVDSDSPHRSIPASMVALAGLDAVDNAKENVILGVNDIDS